VTIPAHFAVQVVLCALLVIVLWAACAGIGLAVLPLERAPADDDVRASWRQMGLAACIGLATLFAIGGVGVLFSVLVAFGFPRIPTIGNLISFRPSVGLIVPVIGAAFMFCVLGALLPAWRAVRTLPAEALRRM